MLWLRYCLFVLLRPGAISDDAGNSQEQSQWPEVHG
jgi:hypothetical protein